MGKDPRFNFYVDNFEGGTELFTLTEDGAYLRLMILQFRQGSFTEAEAIDKLMIRARGNAAACAELWKKLKPKFSPNGFDGENFYSERLQLEISKSAQTSELQSLRAKSRWNKEMPRHELGIDSGTAAGDAFSSISSNVGMSNNKASRVNKKRTTKVRGIPYFFTDLLPENWPKDDFLAIWADYIEIRKGKHASLTENVIKRVVAKLIELSGGSYQKASEIVLQSIYGDWVRFFPVKESGSWQKSQNGLQKGTFGGRQTGKDFIRDKA